MTGCSGYLVIEQTALIIKTVLGLISISNNNTHYTQTCYFPDSAEHFQLFGIKRWYVFKVISEKQMKIHIIKQLTMTHCVHTHGLCRQLPKNPSDQKVKAALDCGAIDEAVDVAGVHCLSVFGAGAFTDWREITRRC